MGSDWRIHHGGGVSGADAQAIADQVALDEARWSRFQPLSDVARITRGAGGSVEVAAATLDLIEAASGWSERTHGVFQPLVGLALTDWGYRGGVGDAAPAGAPQSRLVDGGLIVDRAAGTVTIPKGRALDLGGIGKSWAAVRAGRLLETLCGDDRLIIDAGGDLTIVRGVHTILTAAGPVAAVAGEGVATSSSERRSWTLGDGTVAHHLIDPATSNPACRGTAVVAGTDPVAADVLASCLVIWPELIASLAVPAARISLDGSVATTTSWSEVAR